MILKTILSSIYIDVKIFVVLHVTAQYPVEEKVKN